MSPSHAVVIGGSVAGMSTALALSQRGHRVTIVEQEVLPHCESPVEAFEHWQRRGSPQSRHSHAFLARVHNGIKRDAPALYADLLAAGAEPLRFEDMVREVYHEPALIPEDDEIVLLACRRITFDWVLRRHLERETACSYQDGVTVVGLESETDGATGLPRVTGVLVRDAAGARDRIAADLVVDASGRSTKLRSWLDAIGAARLTQESQSCGIFYCSRFYRLLDPARAPALDGPIGADLGYMKYAIFLGDSHIFSITLAASPQDDALRALRRPALFQAAAAALPTTGPWVSPAVSEPITDVYTFADLKDTRRFFVVDGQPLALGLFPIGDSLMHSNPIAGRGCTFAWLSGRLLADAFEAHGDDPLGFARALDAQLERELVPWYENMRDQDRAALEVSRIEQSGGDPFAFQRADGTIDPKAYMRSVLRDGLLPALREDLDVLRAFMRVFNMLDAPKDILATPGLFQKVLAAWQRRSERERLDLGPGRAEMIQHLESVAA